MLQFVELEVFVYAYVLVILFVFSQGGDKLTLALGGPNSASATFIPNLKTISVPGKESCKVGKKDEDNKNFKDKCSTPVTVTHFSLDEKNGVVERKVLPNSTLITEKLVNVSTTDVENTSSTDIPDLLTSDSTNPDSSFSVLNNNAQINVSDYSLLSPLKGVEGLNTSFSNNPFSNPFKSESYSRTPLNPFQSDTNAGGNPFLDSLNPFIGNQSAAKDALSSLTEEVKTQMEILSKNNSKKVFLCIISYFSCY